MKHRVAVLQTLALKSRVEETLRPEQNDAKDKFFDFAAFLAHEAEVCENYHLLRAYRSSQKRSRERNIEDEKKTHAPSSTLTPASTSGEGEKCQTPKMSEWRLKTRSTSSRTAIKLLTKKKKTLIEPLRSNFKGQLA